MGLRDTTLRIMVVLLLITIASCDSPDAERQADEAASSGTTNREETGFFDSIFGDESESNEQTVTEADVEDAVTEAVDDALFLKDAERIQIDEQVAGDVGRYAVLVQLETADATEPDATQLLLMEEQQEIYQEIFTSEVADELSDVTIGTATTGPTYNLDPALVTSIERQTAEDIDWESDEDMSNLPSSWTVETLAPELQQ